MRRRRRCQHRIKTNFKYVKYLEISPEEFQQLNDDDELLAS
jgi:hypothetical protein